MNGFSDDELAALDSLDPEGGWMSPDPWRMGYPAVPWSANSQGGMAWPGGNFGGQPTHWRSGELGASEKSALYFFVGLGLGILCGKFVF